MITPDPIDTFRNWLLGLMAIILLGFALRVMQPVLVPVTLALFITLVISPVEQKVASLFPRNMRWPGLLAAMAVVLSVFAVFVAVIWVGARRIAGALVGVPRRINTLIRESDLDERTMFGADLENLMSLVGERGVSFISSIATRIINSASTTILTLALTLFLVILMLAEAPRALKKLEALSEAEDTSRWRRATRLIARKLRLYLMARAALGLLTSVCYVLWLWYCEGELLMVWGLMTFLFSFIPNLGSVLSMVLPSFYVWLTGDGTGIWQVIIGLLVIEQVIGNFVDPHVQGQQVSLAPVVILLSVIFWGWLWGPLGALLGVPVMIAVVVAAAHMEPARPFALILSDQSDMEGLDRVALDIPEGMTLPPELRDGT
ncbi:AI-2E family transporter [Pelagovum pacificum]|uniref:AI-2E family transporter n=1 Tax=Pelagovum pacificum TaxID=2588711 RepID=A0A5C5GGQ7_9RHOB|nr:AI-2E family transporter [Pelagovum pacificum]QQA43638.1 AI-2E family transporter [Pelagovum pacificum]TNY33227.1 AI-2E family transporter [Pelagovum pacificum]